MKKYINFNILIEHNKKYMNHSNKSFNVFIENNKRRYEP